MGSVNTQATRSTLTSVDTTLSENITATQNYIPVSQSRSKPIVKFFRSSKLIFTNISKTYNLIS